ncbi:MAG: nucleotidyltransferase family protein [Chloroflexaceae bacterium]|nr:nucleotidyltransferase family protein [Chloroflexaceae bacterium]
MTVETKEQILALLQAHQLQLRRFGVRRCGLFGSFVRNDQRDVDILVEFEPEQKTFDHFMQLAFFLEDLLGPKVDLITTKSFSPYIGPHILCEVEYCVIGCVRPQSKIQNLQSEIWRRPCETVISLT